MVRVVDGEGLTVYHYSLCRSLCNEHVNKGLSEVDKKLQKHKKTCIDQSSEKPLIFVVMLALTILS